MAAEVPTVSAMFAGPIAPLPTLAQAPSPRAGNNSAPAREGQRVAKSGRRRPGGERSTSGDKLAGVILDAVSISASHSSE